MCTRMDIMALYKSVKIREHIILNFTAELNVLDGMTYVDILGICSLH